MKKILSVIVIISLFILLCGVSVYAIIISSRRDEANLRLENAYKADLQEAVSGMRMVEADLSKLMITGNEASISQLLSTIALESSACQQALSSLPIVATGVQNTLKFTNQLSSYCVTALHLLTGSNTLPENFDEQITAFFHTCQDVNVQLSIVEDEVLTGMISLITVIKEEAECEVMFGSIAVDIVEYPSVIFDGPFSDGQAQNTPQQLREEVTPEQAAEYLDSLGFTADFTGQMEGTVPVYSFSSENLEIQISKQGGLLLMALNSRTVGEMVLSEEEARSAAEAFVQKLNYGECDLVWQENYSNCIVFNFTSVQSGIVMYPDIFKVKVAMDTGEIVAFEGKSYIMNNFPRQIPEVNITSSQAQLRLKENFNVETSRLCMIAINNQEELCWEYYGEYDGLSYAVYISAVDGKEKTSFRIISTDTGDMVI